MNSILHKAHVDLMLIKLNMVLMFLEKMHKTHFNVISDLGSKPHVSVILTKFDGVEFIGKVDFTPGLDGIEVSFSSQEIAERMIVGIRSYGLGISKLVYRWYPKDEIDIGQVANRIHALGVCWPEVTLPGNQFTKLLGRIKRFFTGGST